MKVKLTTWRHFFVMFLYDGILETRYCMHTYGVLGYHGLLLAAASLVFSSFPLRKQLRIGNIVRSFPTFVE